MEASNNRSLFDSFSPLFFRALDFFTAGIAFYLAHYFRFANIQTSFEYEILGLLASFVVVASVSLCGGYASWRGKYRIEMIGRIFLAWSLAFMTVLALLVLSHKGEDFSRLWLGYAYLGSLFLAIVARIVLYAVLDYLRRMGVNQKRVLVIGSEKSVDLINESLSIDGTSGFSVFSAMTIDLKPLFGKNLEVSSLESLDSVLRENNISDIWFSLPLKESEFLDQAMFALRYSTVNMRFVPDMSDFRLLNHQLTSISGMPTIDLSASPLTGANGLLKRFEDLFLAFTIMILISPILVIIALAIKFTSQGPIIFKQLRHGVDGKPINVYKFRSMFVHEDAEVKQATKNDSRITPVGAFLRKTSLDELPQFYNVLQGRMSVVGPRPHAIAHNEHYKELIESYMQRHKVKPGITGWAQVNGFRGETDTVEKMERRVEFDLYYIENWSLIFDIKIVIMTIFKGFSNENAY